MHVLLMMTMTFGDHFCRIARIARMSRMLLRVPKSKNLVAIQLQNFVIFGKVPMVQSIFWCKKMTFFQKITKKDKKCPHCSIDSYACYGATLCVFFQNRSYHRWRNERIQNTWEKTGFRQFVFKTSKNWCVLNILGKLGFRWRQDFP